MYREEREMADECKESTGSYAGYEWVRLLKEHPEQADKCVWTRLSGEDWADLLRKQPQFADKCTKWDEFPALGWEFLLKAQPQFAKRYEEMVGKALSGLADAARPVGTRYAELLALDENHFVRDSRLPAACVMDIWASDKVSESWKRSTLKRMMHSNSFYGVMFVPLELEFDCPLNRSVLELIRNQEFDELEGAAFAEKLAEAERTVEGFWGTLLRQFLYTEEYDEAYASAMRDFRRGVEFIERRRPGTVASFSDRFGNNALMYTFGALVESNTYYTLRTPYGIEMARDDMAVLEQLGCSLEAKNIFGISPAMMMRWTGERAEMAE